MVSMMVASDLHLEFYKDNGHDVIDKLPKADVAVVAGDLSTHRILKSSIEMLVDKYRDVVYVAGNHEYYNSSPNQVSADLLALSSRIKNFHWLNNSVLTVKGIKFGGGTLWFRDDPLNKYFSNQLNDFRVISSFVPWVYDCNTETLDFLKRKASSCDVVVTHHLPSEKCVDLQFKGSALNRFFVCECADIISSAKPAMWIYGHTHRPNMIQVDSTVLLCNPLGYPNERSGDPNGIVMNL